MAPTKPSGSAGVPAALLLLAYPGKQKMPKTPEREVPGAPGSASVGAAIWGMAQGPQPADTCTALKCSQAPQGTQPRAAVALAREWRALLIFLRGNHRLGVSPEQVCCKFCRVCVCVCVTWITHGRQGILHWFLGLPEPPGYTWTSQCGITFLDSAVPSLPMPPCGEHVPQGIL